MSKLSVMRFYFFKFFFSLRYSVLFGGYAVQGWNGYAIFWGWGGWVVFSGFYTHRFNLSKPCYGSFKVQQLVKNYIANFLNFVIIKLQHPIKGLCEQMIGNQGLDLNSKDPPYLMKN